MDGEGGTLHNAEETNGNDVFVVGNPGDLNDAPDQQNPEDNNNQQKCMNERYQPREGEQEEGQEEEKQPRMHESPSKEAG